MSNIVTFEQAVRLKEIGYNKPVNYFYHDEDFEENYGKFNWNNQNDEECFSAPTVSEALDYLREEKGIKNAVCMHTHSGECNNVYYYNFYNKNIGASEIRGNFDTHPLAESALLTAVLDYLEKKGGIDES